MKKGRIKTILQVLILILILLSLGITVLGEELANKEIPVVYMDDEEVNFPDQKPFIDNNGRTLVPLRFISEKMGAEVKWVADENKIIIKRTIKEIILAINSRQVIVDGEVKGIDTVPIIVNSRTMVPLRFISEVLGCNITWDPEKKRIDITAPKERFILDKGKIVFDNANIVEGYDMEINGDNVIFKVKFNKNIAEKAVSDLKRNIKPPYIDWYWAANWHITADKYVYEPYITMDFDEKNLELKISGIKLPKQTKERKTASCYILYKGDNSSFGVLFPAVVIEADPNAQVINIKSVAVRQSKPGYVNLIIALTGDPGFDVTASSVDVKKEINGIIDKKFNHTAHHTGWNTRTYEFVIKDIKMPEPSDKPQEVVFAVSWQGQEPLRSAPYTVQPINK
jgi:hypothetical protein